MLGVATSRSPAELLNEGGRHAILAVVVAGLPGKRDLGTRSQELGEEITLLVMPRALDGHFGQDFTQLPADRIGQQRIFCNPSGEGVAIQANHEERIERVLEVEPRFEGIIGPHNLMEAEFGWDVHPYGDHVEIDGILYTHAFRTPRGGAVISGVMPTRQMIMKIPGSHCRVQGHSHLYQWYEEPDSGLGIHGRKITALHAGCYFDIASNAHRWAGYSVNQWRSGILELEVEHGQILSFTFTDIEKIQGLYG